MPSLTRLLYLLAIAALPLMAATCGEQEDVTPDPEAGLPWRGVKFTVLGKNYDFRQTKYYSIFGQDATSGLKIAPAIRTKEDSVTIQLNIGRSAFPDTIDLEREKIATNIYVYVRDTATGTVKASYWSLPAPQNGQGKLILTKVSGQRMLGSFTATLKRMTGRAGTYPEIIQITDGVIDTWQQVQYP